MADVFSSTKCLNELPPVAPRWHWPGRIPQGKIVLLAGPSGAGKTFLALDFAARITTNRIFPGQSPEDVKPLPGPPTDPAKMPRRAGSVLLITPNEDLLDNIRPRLEAAQADVDKFTATSELCLDRLKAGIDRMNDLQLIIIDPLAFLVANNGETRSAADKLFELYQHGYGMSITLLALLPMRLGRGEALRRIPGIDELAHYASIIFAVSPDHREENTNPNRRVLAQLKNNLGPKAPPLAFNSDKGVVDWSSDVISEEDIGAILTPPHLKFGPNPIILEKCTQWLYEFLAPQPKPQIEVVQAAAAAGFSFSTLRRAKKDLKVESKRESANHWTWRVQPGMQDISKPKSLAEMLPKTYISIDLDKVQMLQYHPLGSARELFHCRRQEILLAGPAGTGKTRAILEKMYFCMFRYPGMRTLLVRKTRTSLTQSALVTLEEKVIPPGDPMLNGPSRLYRQVYTLPNSSELVIAGMDNVDRVMSSEYDLIVACEATELTLEDWEKLLTRLRHGMMPYQQAIAECNPSYPDHWLNVRADDTLMLRLRSRHEDNPLYWDPETSQWTQAGLNYRATLERLSGVRRQQLLDGIWAAPEGLVYESLAARVMKTDAKGEYVLPPSVRPHRACAAIDWGWNDPSAVLIGVEGTDGVFYIVDEIYQSRLPLQELAARCGRLFKRWEVELCFGDRSRPDLVHYIQAYNIPCRGAKFDRVDTGRAQVESRLLTDRLRIFERCKSLIAEAGRYQYYGPGASGHSPWEVRPGCDHAMDALRYLVIGMEESSEFEAKAKDLTVAANISNALTEAESKASMAALRVAAGMPQETKDVVLDRLELWRRRQEFERIWGPD